MLKTESESGMPSKVPVGVYQIKVTLKGMKPSIWRRIAVPCDITLGGLHNVIQRAMGWMDCHLHEFVIGGKRYGSATSEVSDFDEGMIDEGRARLNKRINTSVGLAGLFGRPAWRRQSQKSSVALPGRVSPI